MSELINEQNHRNLRRQLLTTVSALSLTLAVSAHAESSDKPTVWIELGGQLERINGLEDPYLPPFTTQSPTPVPFTPVSPSEAQKPSIYSYGGEGSISLHPHGTDWSFTAAIRYGRSSNNKHVHQQTKLYTHFLRGAAPRTASLPRFADFKAQNSENHAILDFQVGRDFGLGFGESTASFGVRMADFTSKSGIGILARPNVDFVAGTLLGKYTKLPSHADYQVNASNRRSFSGVGPSLSFNGDLPVIGGEDGALTLDWGVNGALLFGRQKATGSSNEAAYHYKGAALTGNPPPGVTLLYDHPTVAHNRSRSVTVPNVGFLAGVSFRYPGAKVSFGYRADMFFGAMDMGVGQRDTKDRNFYGPFATISIGLGG
jgi:hypothetical protein